MKPSEERRSCTGSLVRVPRAECRQSLLFSQEHFNLPRSWGWSTSIDVSSEGPSTTATQDERLSTRVYNSDVVFCSKAKAFLYVLLHRRDPGEQKQKFPPLSVIGITSVDFYGDRPWTLETFSVEMSVASDRSLVVRSCRSRRAATREDIGEALKERHQMNTFSP